MRLTIEIIAAPLLLVCISASSAAFAAGKFGRSADGVNCAFILPQNAAAPAVPPSAGNAAGNSMLTTAAIGC